MSRPLPPELLNRAVPGLVLRTSTVGLLGVNNNVAVVGDWASPSLHGAVNSLGPSLIRYPGGTIGDYWDWKTGSAVPACAYRPGGSGECATWHGLAIPEEMFAGLRNHRRGTLQDLRALVDATGAEPMFTLNVITSTLENQLDMLRTARGLGLPVRWVEIGNEQYIGIRNNAAVFPNAQSYCALASRWIQAIRVEFPEARIGVQGEVPRTEESSTRRLNWNTDLVGCGLLDDADAVVLHYYRRAPVPATDRYFEVADLPAFFAGTHVALDTHFTHRAWTTLPDDVPVWVTEYGNVDQLDWSTDIAGSPNINGSWAHALYDSIVLSRLLAEPRVENAMLHVLFGLPEWQAVIGENGLVPNPDYVSRRTLPTTPAGTPMALSSVGESQAMFGAMLAGATALAPVQFDDPVQVSATSDGIERTYPLLLGWHAQDAAGQRRALLVNLSGLARNVGADALVGLSANVRSISADPKAVVVDAASLQRSAGTLHAGQVTLPPYSMSLVEATQQVGWAPGPPLVQSSNFLR